MPNVRLLLVALICATPAILLADGPVVQGLVAGVAALALVLTARSLRPGELKFLVDVIRPAAVLAAVPALWVLLQVLPVGVFAHAIWTSAAAALGRPLAGSISIDPGASLIALGQYLALAAVAFLAAAVAVDRQRAEWVLFALTAAGGIIALVLIASEWLLSGSALTAFAQAQAVDCAAIGIIVAGAASIRTVERYETRQASPQRSVPLLGAAFAASSAVLLVCAAALALDATRGVLVATACGAAAFVGIMIIRRFGLGAWGTAAIAVSALGVAVLLIAAQPAERGRNLLLAFAASPAAAPTAVSARVLDDAPLVGTGAGTFAAMAPIYREMDDPPAGLAASTAAAAFAIGLGRPFVWLIAAAIVGSIIVFLRAALRRGRDSFYPAMGGSCLVAVFLLAFVNAGLLGNAAGLIVAAVIGLAIAQSRSRTVQA